MIADIEKLDSILDELKPFHATLVAVSKKKPAESIDFLYEHGQRDFGENYVQELLEKQGSLPADIKWHFIGHLQSNKIKLITPFVHLIHGIDSHQLVGEVNRQAIALDTNLDVLLQVRIAKEETKFGLLPDEVLKIMEGLLSIPFNGITVRGLMGMASFTPDEIQIRDEFRIMRKLYDTILSDADASIRSTFNILSMGMSTDYKIALSEGSNMVRIGSAIFGERS